MDAVATNPGGTVWMESKWLIHTSKAGGALWNSAEVDPVDASSGVRPYSPRPVRATSPPSCRATSCAP